MAETTTTVDPRTVFPDFYTNDAITSMATAVRWSVSGILGDEAESKGKAPIDARHLLTTGRVRGAFAQDETCLLSLDELSMHLPRAANCAFYLRAAVDGLMVIDIEPGCPEDIALGLLALPGALYIETSMSGRGYHVLVPLPENIHDFPVAANKRVLREEHGWYELLLEHWVTFTRRPIPRMTMDRATEVDLGTAEITSLEDLFASLAVKARPTGATGAAIKTTTEMPEIAHSDRIIDQVVSLATPRMKTPEYFNYDASRYEFSVLGVLYHQLRRVLAMTSILTQAKYDRSDESWLLCKAAEQVLTHRAKHNEVRNGRPFLLDRAATLIGLSITEGGEGA